MKERVWLDVSSATGTTFSFLNNAAAPSHHADQDVVCGLA